MQEALNYLGYAGEHFIEGFLEEAEILPGITIGYILITVLIMSMLIGTLMALPNTIGFNIQKAKDRTEAQAQRQAEREARGAARRGKG